MTITELIQSIATKITQIAQLIADAANVNEIKAERDEAKSGLEAIDTQLAALLPVVPPQE